MAGASQLPAQDDPVRVYPAAAEEPLSTQYTVSADGHQVPVYLATVLAMDGDRRLKHDLTHFAEGDLGQTSFASFDLRGPVQVTITFPHRVQTVKLLPSSSGIVPEVSGNQATFTLPKPGQWVLEADGDWVQSLQIFANPWESDAPDPNDPKVIYYGPGIHKVTTVKVTSGQTVYLAGDAVVYTTPGEGGPVFSLKGDDITLRGRGIIDGSLCPKGARQMINAEGRNISIEGVVLRDASEWNVPIVGADHVTIRNIKVFGYRGNSDGIDVNGSRDVDISDSFLRTGDDLVTIKSKIPEKGETRNVTVERCVLWNELAQALIVGGEMRRDVDNIHFSDCDIVHDKGRSALLRVAQCDSGHVTHVTYDNIRIEECRRLISLRIEAAGIFGRDPDRGHIDGVIFRNIVSTAPERPPDPPVKLDGFDADHAIHDILFDRVMVGGRPLKSSDVKQNAFVDSVRVEP